MPTLERVESFIAVVEAGRYVEAIRDFYHDDATMQENLQPPRAGREALMAHEERVLKGYPMVRTLPVETFFVDGDHVAIRWRFEFENAEGRRSALDEMALQRWRGDRIAEERFYYDPAQHGVAKTAANKRLLQDVFDELAKGNRKPFVECLAPDVRWTLTGTSPWSQTYGGKESVLADFLGPIFEQFATRYTNTASRMTAEGDYVVVECRGGVTTRDGQPYNNEYCWVCRIEGGKVKELTEYMDSALAISALRAAPRPSQ